MELQPVFSHAEPVLAVRDVAETIHYWHTVLGFPVKWIWGEPPVHGGVSWNSAFIQFTQNAELAEASKGNSVWVRLLHLDVLHALHQKNNVEIILPPENQSWGMKQYTIKDINGYYIHFAAPITGRENSGGEFPASVKIISRKPSVKELLQLTSTDASAESKAEKMLAATIHGAVAENTNTKEIIGCALLAGDDVSFYYVKNVMVHPQWQGKRIGSAMMQELSNWLDKNAPAGTVASLICADNLEPFYQQFGFFKVFAMMKEF
jgi:GNAT superfamily N-acetyltransferase